MQIALLDDYQDAARRMAPWDRLPADADLQVFHDHLFDENDLVERLRPFDVVCLMRERTPMPRSLIARLPNLRLIVTTGKNNDSIDLDAANDHGVCVSCTESVGYTTPELTMTLMLALARNLITENRSIASGGWQVGVGGTLRGATLGLAGLGRVGAQVAELGQAFGMRMIAWSQNLTTERASEHRVEAVSKEDLFRQSDYLSIHLRLSQRSRNLFGAPEFALMQPHACLINTARAPLIDVDALVAALDAGHLAAAALDVFEPEPLPVDSPLRHHPKLLLTPHIGYVTQASYDAYYRGTLEAVLAFAAGQPINKLSA